MAPLPRRQPWSSSAEFTQVFDLLFSSNGDAASQRLAVARLHAWSIRAPSAFPVSLASTASFVSLLLPQDDKTSDDPTDVAMKRRLAISMALTRFVNGLLDPMQQGYYARSIGHIAEELGLPGWFVELRHRATHEDLPGEDVLVEAATQALDWLYARYWLPTLHSLSTSSSAGPSPTSASHTSLVSLLHRYKTLSKSRLVDTTSVAPTDFDAIYEDLEAWVDSAAREMRMPGGGGGGGAERDDEEAEEAVLKRLVETLCDAEFLVPRSRKKRPPLSKPAPLPRELLELYEPLIENLASSFTSFSDAYLSRLLSIVNSTSTTSNAATREAKEEESYLATIAGWLARALGSVDATSLGLEHSKRREVIKELLLNPTPLSIAVLTYLRENEPDLLPSESVATLLSLTQNGVTSRTSTAVPSSVEERLAEMQSRWASLNGGGTQTGASAPMDVDGEGKSSGQAPLSELPVGWTMPDATTWRACPIGLLPGGVLPDLAAVR